MRLYGRDLSQARITYSQRTKSFQINDACVGGTAASRQALVTIVSGRSLVTEDSIKGIQVLIHYAIAPLRREVQEQLMTTLGLNTNTSSSPKACSIPRTINDSDMYYRAAIIALTMSLAYVGLAVSIVASHTDVTSSNSTQPIGHADQGCDSIGCFAASDFSVIFHYNDGHVELNGVVRISRRRNWTPVN